VDHNKFDHLNGFHLRSHDAIGVIDHNTFLTMPTRIPLYPFHAAWAGTGNYGDNSWTADLTWGSSDFLFVEDNTIAYDSGSHYACWDNFRGFRGVARFNSLLGCEFETHGTETGGRDRGTRAIEVYKNNINLNGEPGLQIADIRSGSALVWGNTFDNRAAGYGIPRAATLVNDRTTFTSTPWGAADGRSPWDINDSRNPFRTATSSSGGVLSVTVAGAGWTPNQWAGYIIRKTGNCTGNCSSVVWSNTSDTLTLLSSMGHGPDLQFTGGEAFELNVLRAGLDQPGRGGGGVFNSNSLLMCTHSGATASCTARTTHGLNNNQYVEVDGTWCSGCSNPNIYNGTFLATVTGASTFSFTLPSVPEGDSGCCAGAVTGAPAGFNDQHNSPVYEWQNTADGSLIHSAAHSTCNSCTEDLHFYNYTTNFTGSSGVGSGVIASRPGTCTAGVTYWATDQGEWDSTHPGPDGQLYKCISPNTWALYYVPYAYPHPLTSAQTTGDTTAPVPGNSGLVVSSIESNTISLYWTKGTDNVTPQSALQYEVRLSTNNDIDTVARAEAFGAIAKAYATDISSATLPGITAGSNYFLNVILKDSAGNKGIYRMTSVAAPPPPDTTPPVPGNSGLMTSSATSSTITLNWAKATDNASAQSALQYEVRRSASNNLGSVAMAEANGVIVKAYTADLWSANITGLTQSTTYFFNVIVKDSAGNKAVYVARSATTLAGADTTAPVPGNGGTIISSNVGSSSVTLSWIKATDNVSAPSQLFYEVRQSFTGNIDSVLGNDAYGTIVQEFSADVATSTITGLIPNKSYYFNVVVKDAAGNRAAYSMKNVTTAPALDTSAPIPGESGAIATTNKAATSVTLSWAKASDNASAPEQLMYELRRSSSNNIDTVARAESNGAVAQNYAVDIASAVVTGLNPNVTYFFNVIVRDAAGNKAVYQTTSVTTVDTTAPVPGGSGLITSKSNSSTITLNWSRATDNVTTQSALRYEVRSSNSNNIATVANAEANGRIVNPYTTDLVSFVASGLNSGTEYYFNVIVRDEANNKAAYVVRAETTNGKKNTLNTQEQNPSPRTSGRRLDGPPPPVNTALADTLGRDVMPPIPGSAGLITMSGISSNGLTLRWTTASDDTSPKALLRYEVVQSSIENMNTVAEAEANGSVILPYTADASSHAVKGVKNASQQFYTVIVKDEAGNRAVYATAGNLAEEYSFLANAGVSIQTATSVSSPLKVSQVQISPVQGSIAPAGLAIIRSSEVSGMKSATSVALSGGIRTGTLYADNTEATVRTDGVRTGLALANPSAQDVEISFFFTDGNGIEIKSGVYTLLANRQISAFLDESPFNGPAAFRGTFTFASSAPISATGTRTMIQKSGEFQLQSLPVTTDSAASSSRLLPLFVDGNGWSTEVILMNRSTTLQTGSVQFSGPGPSGDRTPVIEMTVNGVLASTFNYSVPPRSIARLVTSGTGSSVKSGSVRIMANAGEGSSSSAPDAVAIVSFKDGGETVSETTLSALPTGTKFRAYVESSNSPVWVSSGLSVANSSNVSNMVNFELHGLDGSRLGSTSLTLPPNGHVSQYLKELFPNLGDGFKGLVHVTSAGPVAFAVLHCMYNADGQFMFTSTPVLNEANASPSGGLTFPLVAAGAGYDTQLVLYGRSGQSGEGEIQVISRDGVPQTTSSLGIVP